MTLKSKLIMLCGVPIAGLAVCMAVSTWLSHTINRGVTQARDESAVFADEARRMQLNVIQVQQFLTDVSVTRGQDGLDDGFGEAKKNYEQFLTSLDKFQKLFEQKGDQKGLQEIAAIRSAFQSYYDTGHQMAEQYVKDGTSAGNKMMGSFDKASDNLTAALDPFVQAQTDAFNHSLNQIADSGQREGWLILWGGGALVALTVVLATLHIRAISRQIQHTTASLADVSEQLSNASRHLSSSSQTMAEGATEQAASLEETSSSLEQMSSMIKRNSENTQKANALAREARTAADKGAAGMESMTGAIDAIKSSSDDIAKIIKTIDEIAFQTNILALNAAVEAARAGEAGMSFAVVADEVRNLAQRSAQAARETAGMIESAISKTAQGVDISNKVAMSLQEILAKSRQVDELVTEVATASSEQSQGITQINTAVSQMDKVTQSNAANAEESAAAAEELNAQAGRMEESVAELLKLVGGRKHLQQPVASPAIVSQTRVKTAAVPQKSPEKPEASIPMPGGANGSHHGHEAPLPQGPGSHGIRWNAETMATGVESIDEQHQELIEMINELDASCRRGEAREHLEQMVNFMADYAKRHFDHEEGIMDETRCPARGRNKVAHKQFLLQFSKFQERFQKEGATTSLVLELKNLASSWLTSHICKIDTNLRACAHTCHAENGSRSAH